MGQQGYQEQCGPDGMSQASGECLPGLPDHGLQPGQLLSVQGTLRHRGRRGAARDLAAEAVALKSGGPSSGRHDRHLGH